MLKARQKLRVAGIAVIPSYTRIYKRATIAYLPRAHAQRGKVIGSVVVVVVVVVVVRPHKNRLIYDSRRTYEFPLRLKWQK